MLDCTTDVAAVEYKMSRSVCGRNVRLRKFLSVTNANETLI